MLKKALPLIEDKDLLSQIIEEFLILGENENFKNLSYLQALMRNNSISNLKMEIKNSRIEQKIKSIINDRSLSLNYYFKILTIIRPILTSKDENELLESLKIRMNSGTYIKHDLLPLIIHLSNGDVNLYDMIKIKILNQKEIWPTAIYCVAEKVRSALMGYSTFPYYEISKRKSFQTGIIWSKIEIEKIFKNLKNSLKKIEMFEEQFQQVFQNSFLIIDMYLFLKVEKSNLADDEEYIEIFNRVEKRYRQICGFKSLRQGLISQDSNVLYYALEEFDNYLREKRFKDLIFEWKIVIDRVLFKREPLLDSSLIFISDWLTNLRESQIQKELVNSYLLILKDYFENPPTKFNKPIFYEKIIQIAMVLQEWGCDDIYIKKWLQIKKGSRFLNLKSIRI